MSKKFNGVGFAEKLSLVNRTKDSIHKTSLWILEHKHHSSKIVGIWLEAIKDADVDHRLTLFYVANDVMQHAKHHHALLYQEEFSKVLAAAVSHANHEAIRQKILRLIDIWEARSIYQQGFLTTLRKNLIKVEEIPHVEKTNNSPFGQDVPIVFNVHELARELEQIKKIKNDVRRTRILVGDLEKINVNIGSITCMGQAQQVKALEKLKSSVSTSTAHIKALEEEAKQENKIVRLLEISKKFYNQQNTDVRTVAQAYKMFGRKLKRQQKKLNEKKVHLASGNACEVSASALGEPSIVKPEEVSTLDQRLSILTQGINSLHGIQGNSWNSSSAQDPSQQSLSHISSLNEGQGCSVSPKEAGKVNLLNIDSEASPCSTKSGGTPSSSAVSFFPVPFTVKSPDESTAKHPSPTGLGGNTDSPVSKSPAGLRDIIDATVFRSPATVTQSSNTQDTTQQDNALQSHPSVFGDSNTVSDPEHTTKGDTGEIMFICEQPYSGNPMGTDLPSNNDPVSDMECESCECSKNKLQGYEGNLESTSDSCSSSGVKNQAMEENGFLKTTEVPDGSPKEVEIKEDENDIDIIAECPPITVRKKTVSDTCRPEFLRNMVQALKAARRVLPRKNNTVTESMLATAKMAARHDLFSPVNIMKVCSFLSSVSPSHSVRNSSLLDVVVLNEKEESSGKTSENCNHRFQDKNDTRQEVDKAEMVKEARKTENLEIMDMDLGSSDEEKT